MKAQASPKTRVDGCEKPTVRSDSRSTVWHWFVSLTVKERAEVLTWADNYWVQTVKAIVSKSKGPGGGGTSSSIFSFNSNSVKSASGSVTNTVKSCGPAMSSAKSNAKSEETKIDEKALNLLQAQFDSISGDKDVIRSLIEKIRAKSKATDSTSQLSTEFESRCNSSFLIDHEFDDAHVREFSLLSGNEVIECAQHIDKLSNHNTAHTESVRFI
jgi:hypothetical protein